MIRIRLSRIAPCLAFLYFSCLLGVSPSATTITIRNTADSRLAEKVVRTARDMLGTPYRWAGATKTGVDCSGLIYYVFGEVTGAKLPRRVRDLYNEGRQAGGELRSGDLLFFDTMNGGYASHVGISLGGREFIHSASEGPETGVILSNLDESYYKTRYLGARRLIQPAALDITITLDEEAATTAFSADLDPEQEVFVNIICLLPNPDYLRFHVTRKGKPAVSKRFREGLEGEVLKTSFVPESGDWTITLTDDIKRELATVRFSGKPGG